MENILISRFGWIAISILLNIAVISILLFSNLQQSIFKTNQNEPIEAKKNNSEIQDEIDKKFNQIEEKKEQNKTRIILKQGEIVSLFKKNQNNKKLSLKDLEAGFVSFINNSHGLSKKKSQLENSNELRTQSYRNQVIKMLHDEMLDHEKNKELLKTDGHFLAFIEVRIKKNGRLVSVKIITPSKNKIFDQIAVESAKKVKFYPSLPRHIIKDPYDLQLYITN